MSFHHLVHLIPVEPHTGPVVCDLSSWFNIPQSVTGHARPRRGMYTQQLPKQRRNKKSKP